MIERTSPNLAPPREPDTVASPVTDPLNTSLVSSPDSFGNSLSTFREDAFAELRNERFLAEDNINPLRSGASAGVNAAKEVSIAAEEMDNKLTSAIEQFKAASTSERPAALRQLITEVSSFTDPLTLHSKLFEALEIFASHDVRGNQAVENLATAMLGASNVSYTAHHLALEVLAEVNSPSAQNALLQVAANQSGNVQTRLTAIRQLAEAGNGATIEQLRSLAAQEPVESMTRLEANASMARLGDPEARALIIQMYRERQSLLLAPTYFELLRESGDIAAIRRELSNPNDTIKQQAALSLTTLGDSVGIAALRDFANRGSELFVDDYVKSLSEPGAEHILGLLPLLINHNDPAVRERVSTRLWETYVETGREPEFVSLLTKAVQVPGLPQNQRSFLQDYTQLIREAADLGIRNFTRYEPELLRHIVQTRNNGPQNSNVVVCIYPTFDNNGAFQGGDNSALQQLRSKGNFNLLVYEVGDKNELQAALQQAREMLGSAGASNIILSAHGTPQFLDFRDHVPDSDTEVDLTNPAVSSRLVHANDDALLSSLAGILAPNGTIVINGCDTGSLGSGEENLARAIRRNVPNARPGGILAPDNAFYRIQNFDIQEGRINNVTFDGGGRDIRTMQSRVPGQSSSSA